MRKIKIGILTGILLVSMFFLFIQPIKAENEIVPIDSEEDVSISGNWDEDGIFTGYENHWKYDLFLGDISYSGERSNSIIFLKFNIPNKTLGEYESITSMKLRLTQKSNYGSFEMPIKTELVENNWVSENMTWDNKPESIGSSIIYTNFTFVSNVMNHHYIELIDFIDDIENETMSIKIVGLPRDWGYPSVVQFIAKGRGEIFEYPVLIMKYEDMSPPTPFTLTSNAGNPDKDGLFTLSWTDSEHVNDYSVYQNGSLIVNGLMNQYLMEIPNGTYSFKIIALNNYGSINSNEIIVIIEIPPPPPPNPFMLTSDVNNPDIDGIFTLYWTESTHANSYSVYCDDILLDNGLTELYYDVRIYTSGNYNFKIKAFNDYGNISSNEITVNINIPLPSPTPFTLTSNADNPDEDGLFMLYWSSSEYGNVYSVYCDDVLLEWGIIELYCNIKVYASGSYDFKVVALNDYGQTDSNEITVNVDIYI